MIQPKAIDINLWYTVATFDLMISLKDPWRFFGREVLLRDLRVLRVEADSFYSWFYYGRPSICFLMVDNVKAVSCFACVVIDWRNTLFTKQSS